MAKPFDRIVGPHGEWIDTGRDDRVPPVDDVEFDDDDDDEEEEDDDDADDDDEIMCDDVFEDYDEFDDDDEEEEGDGEIVGDGGDVILYDGLDERESCAVEWFNAAVNLYGIVTHRELSGLFNHYAAEKGVAAGMDEDEVAHLVKKFLALDEPNYLAGEFGPEIWFADALDERTGERILVYYDIIGDSGMDFPQPHPNNAPDQTAEARAAIQRKIARRRDAVSKYPMKMLPLQEFTNFSEPMFGGEYTKETKTLAKFLRKKYFLDKLEAENDVWAIQAHIRVNEPTITNALEFIESDLGWAPENRQEFMKLVDVLSPVVYNTRGWNYRGHTASEMHKLGFIGKCEVEHIPDVFHLDDAGRSGGDDSDEWLDKDVDADDDGDYDLYGISLVDLPPAKYTGPIDFKFVKDPKRRDEMIGMYDILYEVVDVFVKKYADKELKNSKIAAAGVRLGLNVREYASTKRERITKALAGYYAMMLDDQNGKPAIQRLLERRDSIANPLLRRAAEYYANCRYTWLKVLAAKAGVGMKCHDMLTGEELFLLDPIISKFDVKGRAVCASISPIGDVYCHLGFPIVADTDAPDKILADILANLDIPAEFPLELSFADQAKFAVASIMATYREEDAEKVLPGYEQYYSDEKYQNQWKE